MIIDRIENAAFYAGLNAGIRSALEFLDANDFSTFEAGRYDIDGDDLFALVQEYTTKPREDGVWEAHRRYIDVQYVAAGLEAMGWAPISALTVTEPYDADKDCVLLAGTGDIVTAPAGTFVVFLPEDAHMPCLEAGSSQTVCKVVVKIAVRSDQK